MNVRWERISRIESTGGIIEHRRCCSRRRDDAFATSLSCKLGASKHYKFKRPRRHVHADWRTRRNHGGRNPCSRHAGDGQEIQGARPHPARPVRRRPGRQRHRRGLPGRRRGDHRRSRRARLRAGAQGALRGSRTGSDQTGDHPGRGAQHLRPRRLAAPGGGRRDRLRARGGAAHHARAEHGRPLIAGQHRRLQGGDDGSQRVSDASFRC